MEKDKIEEIEAQEPLAELEAPPKTKKPRSEKQIQAFELARQKRDANRKARAEEKLRQEEQSKMELEDKIVHKAIQIKKKQIMKAKVLDEISDDETNIEEVKKTVKRVARAPPAEVPAYEAPRRQISFI